MTKSEILELVWPGVIVEENNIAAQIVALRRVLGPHLIVTVSGYGYRLEVEAVGIGPPGYLGHDDAAGRAAPRSETDPWLADTGLIGRNISVAFLRDALRQPGCVTLVGPAGVGKTSLARVAASAWPGRVIWADLSGLSAGAQVMGAIARALGQQAPGIEATVALGDNALLVLDSAEHVARSVGPAAELLLRAAPETRVLVTSQVTIALPRNIVHWVEPLPIPQADIAPLQALEEGAVGLLVARIKATGARIALDADQLPLLRALCDRLDGLPLAIEMAAARVPMMGLRGVNEALGERFALLTVGRNDAPERHRTLHAALDWSYGLLPAEDQKLFRSLGVFAGRFTLDLAMAVATDAPKALRWAMIDRLGQLVDRNLVVATPGELQPFRLLETMRSFALMQLAMWDEETAVRTRYASAMRSYLRQIDVTAALATGAERDRIRDQGLAALDHAGEALAWAVTQSPETAIALSTDIGLLAIHLALDVGLLPSAAHWHSQTFEWMTACESLVEEIPDVLLQAHWWQAFALHLVIRGEVRAAMAARRAAELWREHADDLGLFCSLLCCLRAPGDERAGSGDRDELARALLELDDICARNPEWPDALPEMAAAARASLLVRWRPAHNDAAADDDRLTTTFHVESLHQPARELDLHHLTPDAGVALAALRYHAVAACHSRALPLT